MLCRLADILAVKCQEAAASNSTREEPQIRTLLSAPRPSNVENLGQHIRLCFYSPFFSFRKNLPLSAENLNFLFPSVLVSESIYSHDTLSWP